jgi:hypothetical protein
LIPKEKAKQLVDKFKKDLALVCVDEIIEFGTATGIREPMMYWSRVKSEINKHK